MGVGGAGSRVPAKAGPGMWLQGKGRPTPLQHPRGEQLPERSEPLPFCELSRGLQAPCWEVLSAGAPPRPQSAKYINIYTVSFHPPRVSWCFEPHLPCSGGVPSSNEIHVRRLLPQHGATINYLCGVRSRDERWPGLQGAIGGVPPLFTASNPRRGWSTF